MWIAPKTNWTAADVFDLSPDYERIRGNILYLQEKARRLYLSFDLADMAGYAVDDFPFAEFFSHVDNNVDTLLDNTFRPPRIDRARDYSTNGRIWDYNDLNRIESALLRLYHDLNAQEQARMKLAFKLGGGMFGTCI